MGMGDDIMATAYAKAARQQHPNAKVVFGNPDTYFDAGSNTLAVHYSEVFENNSNILVSGEEVRDIVCVPDYPGSRIYVDYENSDIDDEGKITRFKWRPEFSAPRGELFFSIDEKSQAGETAMVLPYGFIVIEPEVAEKPWFNHKGWPRSRWQQVVDALPDVAWVQLGPALTLDRVNHVSTPSFRHACAVLSTAGGFVGTDGGLHHAAAALDVPATVLWGHYSSPAVFGYDVHYNVRAVDNVGCGSTWVECEECHAAMEAVSVDQVVEQVKEMLKDGRDKTRDEGSDGPIFRMVGATPEGQEG